jgi:large subunit ribosomal protein L18
VIYRSNKHFESQIINDFDSSTLASSSSKDSSLKKEIKSSKSKTDISIIVGKTIAEKAIKKKIKNVVFDRNGYPFHGRVKAFADAAREAGLEF